MLAIRLDPEVEARLDALAKATGRTKSFYAREAIMEHLEDLESYYLAAARIKSANRNILLSEVEQERLAVHEEIAAYAAQQAGSVDDLDEELESASLEHLDNSEPLP